MSLPRARTGRLRVLVQSMSHLTAPCAMPSRGTVRAPPMLVTEMPSWYRTPPASHFVDHCVDDASGCLFSGNRDMRVPGPGPALVDSKCDRSNVAGGW